jgi:hypothetical protein
VWHPSPCPENRRAASDANQKARKHHPAYRDGGVVRDISVVDISRPHHSRKMPGDVRDCIPPKEKRCEGSIPKADGIQTGAHE